MRYKSVLSDPSIQRSSIRPGQQLLAHTSPHSYEGSLFGWNVEEDQAGEGLQSTLTFGFNCCPSSLRAVAISESGRYLACGGVDERIRIYSMRERKSVGEVSNQVGAITVLRFFGDSFLFSGSEDNTISIWRVHDWVCMHILGGHKGSVNDLAVHPSGKLALSVSKDSTLRLWNLVQGRCSFTRRLKAPADRVLWSEDAGHYLLLSQGTVQVYAAADNACLSTVVHQGRVNQAVFIRLNLEYKCSSSEILELKDGESGERGNDIFVAAVTDSRMLHLYDGSGRQLAVLDISGLGGRPKDMQAFKLPPLYDFRSSSASGSSIVRALLDGVGDLLMLVTSSGTMAVLSAQAVYAIAKKVESEMSIDGNNYGDRLAECLLTSAQLKVEPRLVAGVVYVPTNAGNEGNRSKTSKKNSQVETIDGEIGFSCARSNLTIENTNAMLVVAKTEKKSRGDKNVPFVPSEDYNDESNHVENDKQSPRQKKAKIDGITSNKRNQTTT